MSGNMAIVGFEGRVFSRPLLERDDPTKRMPHGPLIEPHLLQLRSCNITRGEMPKLLPRPPERSRSDTIRYGFPVYLKYDVTDHFLLLFLGRRAKLLGIISQETEAVGTVLFGGLTDDSLVRLR